MADISDNAADWSATAGSNSPSGSTAVGTGLDDNLRAIQAAVVAALLAKGSDIASASSIDLSDTNGLFHDITGTTTITGLGTVRAGIWKVLKFEGALTLTHNATSLILLSQANRTTSVGAVGIYMSEGSGNWRELFYADGDETPVGAVIPYAGTSAPGGWLLCYGQAISRTDYARLFAVISTTYGSGDGSTTFNVPDLRGRVVAGQDDMGGSSANRLTDQSGGLDGDTLGDTGGSETHTLVSGEMPAHTHTVAIGSGGVGSSGLELTQSSATGGGTVTSSSTGSGGAHNNVQPTIILNYIIKI